MLFITALLVGQVQVVMGASSAPVDAESPPAAELAPPVVQAEAVSQSVSVAPPIAQAEVVSESVSVPPVASESEPYRQTPEHEEQIRVSGLAIVGEPPAEIQWSIPIGLGAEVVQQYNPVGPSGQYFTVGEEVPIWVVFQNSTGACGGPEVTLTNLTPILTVDGENVTLPLELFGGSLAPCEYRHALIPYVVPADADNELAIQLVVSAQNGLPFPDGPNVLDVDLYGMSPPYNGHAFTVLGPAVQQNSFTVDPPEAEPGEFVTFTLEIESIRDTGTPITSITVDEAAPPGFATRCGTTLGWWTDPDTGTPYGGSETFDFGEKAVCEFEYQIPADTTNDSMTVSGILNVADASDIGASLIVVSDTLDIMIPAMEVNKSVDYILRQGQPLDPGQLPTVGDVVYYTIEVINTGDVPLTNFFIFDQLIGMIPGPVSDQLEPAGEPGDTYTASVSYMIRQSSSNPLTNIVTVEAFANGRRLQETATALVNLMDSVLQLELRAENPATGEEITFSDVGQPIQYRLTVHNNGPEAITGLAYVPLSPPLRTVVTPPDTLPPALPSVLAGNSSVERLWTYTPTGSPTDEDPLISTVRATGKVGTLTVTDQDAATVDLTVEGIGIKVDILEPSGSTTVLRGGEARYEVSIINTSGLLDLTSVHVDQYVRRPDGTTSPVQLNIPMTWGSGTQGLLNTFDGEWNGGPDEATGVVAYLVTWADEDPLEMIFEVRGIPHDPVGGSYYDELVDRTNAILEISNLQVNTELIIQGLPEGEAVDVGDTLTFAFGVQNVGNVSLSNPDVTWCVVHRRDQMPPPSTVCDVDFDLLGNPTEITAFESAGGTFDYTVSSTPTEYNDAEAVPFLVEVILTGIDNKGKEILIRTAVRVPIATPGFDVTLSGPAQGVPGDTVTFNVSIQNNTGTVLTGVNVLDPFGGSLSGECDNMGTLNVGATASCSFPQTLTGAIGEEYTQTIRARGGTSAYATESLDVMLVPAIAVAKEGPDEGIRPSDIITYTVTITNQSVRQLVITSYSDLVIDPSGSGIGHCDFSSDPDNYCIWPNGPGTEGVLNYGQSVTGTFTHLVEASPNPLVNVFTVNGTLAGTEQVTGFGEHEVELSCPISISMLPVINSDEVAGYRAEYVPTEVLTWQIVLRNESTLDLYLHSVEDTLSGQGDLAGGWGTLPSILMTPGMILYSVPFDKLITGEYYHPDGAEMAETVTIQYASDAAGTGMTSCTNDELAVALNPPLVPLKIPNPVQALTGDTVEYFIFVANQDDRNNITATVIDTDYQGNQTVLITKEFQHYQAGPPEVIDSFTTTTTWLVTEDDPDELVNRLSVEFTDPTTPDRTMVIYTEATVNTSSPLTVEKTSGAEDVQRGMTIQYDYTITNTTEFPAQITSIVDDKLGVILPGDWLEGNPNWIEPGGGADPYYLLAPFGILSIPARDYTVPLVADDPLVNTVTVNAILVLEPTSDNRSLTYTVPFSIDLVDPEIVITKYAVDAGTGDPLPDERPLNTAPDGVLEGEVNQLIRYCYRVENRTTAETVYALELEDASILNLEALQEQFLDATENTAPIDPASPPSPLPPAVRGQLGYGMAVDFCYVPPSPETDIALTRDLGDPNTTTAILTGEYESGLPFVRDDELVIDLLGTDLLVSKEAVPLISFVGDEITYRIVIQNMDPLNYLDVTSVTDAFSGAPVPIDLDDFDWTYRNCPTSEPGCDTNPYRLGPDTGGTGVNGGRATYEYPYTVQPTDPDPLSNTVTATGTVLATPDPFDTVDSARATVAVTSSQLRVTKVPSKSTALPGETIDYQITITNVGSLPVSNLQVSDPLYTAGPLVPGKTTLQPYGSTFVFYSLAMPNKAALQADPTLDPYPNTVTVTGDVYPQSGDPQTVVGTAQATVDLINPALSIVKTPITGAVTVGDDAQYTVTIINKGTETLALGVVEDETSGQNWDLASVCPGLAACIFTYGNGDYEGDRYNFSNYQLPAGVYVEATITIPNIPASPDGQYTNTINVTANRVPPTSPLTDRTSATIDVRDEGIDVVKQALTPAVPVGQPALYTITVTNIGGVSIDRLVIADLAMDIADPTYSITIEGAGVFDEAPGTDPNLLEPGESFSMDYQHVLLPSDDDPFVNEVVVAAHTVVGSRITDRATATVDVQPAAVAVEKTACAGDIPDATPPTAPGACTQDLNLTEGNTITYYVHVSNPSVVPLDVTAVTDSISGDIIGGFVWPGSGGADLDPTDGSPGGSDEAWLRYTYDYQTGDPDPLTNVVAVTAQTTDGTPIRVQDSDEATVNIATSNLQLIKTSSAIDNRAFVNQTVTYTLEVRNTSGTHPITGVTVVDPMSPSGTGPMCTTDVPINTTVTCGTYTHLVTITDPNPLVNTAAASGMQDGVRVTDTTSLTLDIVTAGLEVTKTADMEVARVGVDTVTYTYRIRNTSTNLSFRLVGVDDSDPTITFTVGNDPSDDWPMALTPGQEAIVIRTLPITAAMTDPYVNTVTVTGFFGSQERTASATETVYISSSDMAVSATANRPFARPGEAVIFTYRIVNLGSAALTDLTLTDALCTVGNADYLNDQLPDTTLEVGEENTVYCTQTAPDEGSLLAVLDARATFSVSNDTIDTAMVEVPVISGDLIVTKEADHVAANPGNTINYTVTIRNISAEPISITSVDDTLVTLLPAPPDPLVSGQTHTMTGSIVVPPSPNYDDPTINEVTVTGVGDTSNDDYEDSEQVSVAIIEGTLLNDQLVLSVEANPLRAGWDDWITYTFRVQNIGDETATSNYIRYAISQTGTGSLALQTPIALPDLAPSNVVVVTASHQVPGDFDQNYFRNNATVFSDVTIPGNPTNGTSHDNAIVDVRIARTEVTATIDNIYQLYDDDGNAATPPIEINSPYLRTGLPVYVDYSLTNTGNLPLTTYGALVETGISGVTCAGVSTDPATLPAVINADEVVSYTCMFIPPIADAMYGVNPFLVRTFQVTGTASSDVEASDPSTYTLNYTLVDIQLQVELGMTVTPSTVVVTPARAANEVVATDSVVFNVTLRNTGYSPVGCATATATDLCHLQVDTDNTMLQALLDGITTIANTVIPAQGQQVFTTAAHSVGTADITTTFTVTAFGGHDRSPYAYYTTPSGITDSETLTVIKPQLTVTAAAVPANPMVGSQVTYNVTVLNSGRIAVNTLAGTYRTTAAAWAVPDEDGIMLVDGSARPRQQTSITLSVTALDPSQTATGTTTVTEHNTSAYNLDVTITGIGAELSAVSVAGTTRVTPVVPTATPGPGSTSGPASTAIPYAAGVDPSTLDPNATEPTVTKEVDVEVAQPGAPVTWTVTIRNGTTSAMSNILVRDDVPTQLVIDSTAVNRGSTIVEGQLVTVTTGSLLAGEVVTLVINTTVDPALTAPAEIENTACATREGGQTVCASAAINQGPDAETLPAAGMQEASGGQPWRLEGLFGILFIGAMMLLLSTQAVNRRWLLVGLVLVLAVAVVVGLLALGGDGGKEKATPESAAQVGQTEEAGEAATPLPVETEEVAPPTEVMSEFPPTHTPYILPTPAGERTLLIPKLKDSFPAPIPIVELPLVNRQWDVSGLGFYIGWLEGTTWMDSHWGNTVLTAHVQLGFHNPGPFWGIGDLVPGDEIIVQEGPIERRFMVKSVRKVDPNDVSVTAPTNTPVLTLITCTEWDQSYGVFSQRMVVQAVPVGGEASG